MNNYLDEYKYVSEVLSKYGWFINGEIIGGDFDRIKLLCEEIESKNYDKDTCNEKINYLLSPIIFNPYSRAFVNYRFLILPHLNKFSHLVDKATFHYFKKDLLSSINCLTPVIEGVLLSYNSWSIDEGKRKPSLKELVENICAKEGEFRHHLRKLYNASLKNCLHNWFYANTNSFDFESSNLNRHYISHSLGNDNYYSISECNRMFSIVNLLCEIIAIESRYFPAFIPENIPEIDDRVNLYYELMWKRISLKKALSEEERLLNQNKYYVSQESLLNFREIVEAENKKHNDFSNSFNTEEKEKVSKINRPFPFIVKLKKLRFRFFGQRPKQ
ncbi:hypothetical protein [Winogradskyella forsetii]|uniref:hypothetical protein n=1 Tax=Winogradskyella forsetii TaxID=2686077 RepID=UPI0015BEA873|nr:hypothetical protein [Winogradskyella forsetii]